jgi:hypothetical protein
VATAHPTATPQSSTERIPAVVDTIGTLITARALPEFGGEFMPIQSSGGVLGVNVLTGDSGLGTLFEDEGSQGDEGNVAVIGRIADTDVAKEWPGHEVLDLPQDEWTVAKNDEWVQSVIDRNMSVYVGSPPIWENLWDAANDRATVFGRELSQFMNAGYSWQGSYLRPPGS